MTDALENPKTGEALPMPASCRPPHPWTPRPGERSLRLGIDRVVRACRKRLNRVIYEVAPNPDIWHIPEEVVIYRWRRRSAPDGRTYHGFRLPPGTWRTVLACPSSLDWMTASEQQVADALRWVRRKHDGRPLRSPGAGNLLLLVRYLSRRRKLADILERHRHVDPESPGSRTSSSTGRTATGACRAGGSSR